MRLSIGNLFSLPANYAFRYLAREKLRSVCHNSRAIVLTYDDGPGTRLSRSLSEMLLSHGVRGTFFLLGRRVALDTETVDMLAREGHELGSHSYDHLHAWKSDTGRVLEDIDAGFNSVSRWVKPDGLFRPPHGKVTFTTWRALRKRGSRICWWTVDSGDTWPVLPTPQSIVDRVLRAGGGVVLMHDFDRGPDREEFVLKTTEALLVAAKSEGFRILKFSDLITPDAFSPKQG
ncbi:MAG: polysaccharide deacetylase family protein [Candidatus Hydrogenedentes bacterium]|nr:polysaccharide deacetylase family protein [Candidatus Hydrogenedentota bacterium]